MTDGLWRVSVCTQYSTGNHTVKQPRTYELTEPIAVGESTVDPGDDGDDTGGGMG